MSKRIFVCVIFNLVYEFAFRGFAGFLTVPVLLPLLTVFYISYYSFLNYLIQKFKLHNYELFAVITLIGLPVSISFNGFRQKLEFGMFFIQDFSWAFVLQGLFTFYLANRFFPRDWNEPLSSKKGVFFSLLGIILTISAFFKGTKVLERDYHPLSILITFFYFGFWLIFLLVSLKFAKHQMWGFTRSKLLDFITISTFFICLILGLIPFPVSVVANSVVRTPAILVFVGWTFIFTAVYLYYRLKNKREVPI